MMQHPAPPRDMRLLRFETLLRLRWYTAIFQLLCVAIVHWGIGLHLPIAALGLVLALAISFNLALRTRFQTGHRVDEAAAFIILVADTLQLAALLFLTGGIANPFAIFFLGPVLISATTLPRERTLAIGLIAFATSSLIALTAYPMPWFDDDTLDLPVFYQAWIWLALQCGILFIGIYARRIALEARQLADALAATELVLAREQHLIHLDGLATAAAHELGTPLATIALVAKELLHAKGNRRDIEEDLRLIKEQSDRCKTIIAQIATLQGKADPLVPISMTTLIDEVLSRYGDPRIAVLRQSGGEGPEPACLRNPGLLYGLGNLVRNAVEFAHSRVAIRTSWSANEVEIQIDDDGPGLPADILKRLGDPYSRRPTPVEIDVETVRQGGGMGLGIFIARTLLERSGATLEASNNADGAPGATMCLIWPRHLFENLDRSRFLTDGFESIVLPGSPRSDL